MPPARGREKRNRVSEVADRLLREGRGGELERELGRFDPDRLEEAERESWHHLRGVAAFWRGDRAEALRRFAAGHASCPESVEIRFSLAQELQHFGRVDEAFPLFDGCELRSLHGAYAMTAARYAYLWGELERGLSYLDPVLAAYDELGIVDDHFLYMRNLPFFGEAWATLGALHELLGSPEVFFAYTERAARQLRDYDFTELKTFVAALRSGDFLPVIDRLAGLRAEQELAGSPTGYAAMLGAVLRAVTTDAARPHDLLDSVSLADEDFPWLEDVRTLAHVAIASRESEADLEAELVDRFRARQPLLFEPHHAFDFRLLDVQELLRPAYQAACRARRSDERRETEPSQSDGLRRDPS
jgi:tetratricopeptide (TPR) repeat protein